MGSMVGRMHYYYSGDISGALVGVDSGTILTSCSSVAEFPIHQCTQTTYSLPPSVLMYSLAQCTSVYLYMCIPKLLVCSCTLAVLSMLCLLVPD